MQSLTSKSINLRLKKAPQWRKHGNAIVRTYTFSGFEDAIKFVNLVAKQAQRSKHHPDIDIRYDKVSVKLSTHDAGGITGKDFALAAKIDNNISTHFAIFS